MKAQKVILIGAFIVLLFCIGCAYQYGELEYRANVVVPAWAPFYDDIHHVRYYYLPDIEVYYDVWNQEFVYLEDGSWVFTPVLPPMYAGFDLYNSFVVILDAHVYEPWMHHQYYVAHYPRFYYRTVYHVTDTHEIRGFNENKAAEIRLKPEERAKLDEASKHRPENEKVQLPQVEQRKVESTKSRQRMKYYGNEIGKPVKVKKEMRKPKEKSQRSR